MIYHQAGNSRSPSGGSSTGRRQSPQPLQRLMDVFEVMVDVIGASDLSLSSAYIGSSMFCSVHVDGLHIGSTPVVPRTQNPAWNHSIRAPLAAVKNVLVVFKIYCQNIGIENEILIGVASIPLDHQGMIGPAGSTLSWPLQDGSGSINVRIMTRYFRDMAFLRAINSGSEKDLLFKPPNHMHNMQPGILNRRPRFGASLNGRVIDGMLANCHLFSTHQSRSLYGYISADVEAIFEARQLSYSPFHSGFSNIQPSLDAASIGNVKRIHPSLILAVRGRTDLLRLNFEKTFDLLSFVRKLIRIGLSVNICGVKCVTSRLPDSVDSGIIVSPLGGSVSIGSNADCFAGDILTDVRDVLRAAVFMHSPPIYRELNNHKSFLLSFNVSWVDVREHSKSNSVISNVNFSSIPFATPGNAGDVVKSVVYVLDTHAIRRFVGFNGTNRYDTGHLGESLMYYHGSVETPIFFDDSTACGGFKVSVYAELVRDGSTISSVCLCDQFVVYSVFFDSAVQQNTSSNIFVVRGGESKFNDSPSFPLYRPMLNMKLKLENKSRVFKVDCIGLQRIPQYLKSECGLLMAYQLLAGDDDDNVEYNAISEEDLKAVQVKSADSELHLTITEPNSMLVAARIRISLLILDINDRSSFSHKPIAYFDVPAPLFIKSSSDGDVEVTKYVKYEWNISPKASDSSLSLINVAALLEGYVLVNCSAELGESSCSKLPFEATAKLNCKLTRQEVGTEGWQAIADVGHDGVSKYPIASSNAEPETSLSRSHPKDYLSVSLVRNMFCISRCHKLDGLCKDYSKLPFGRMVDFLVLSSNENDSVSGNKSSLIEVYQVVPVVQHPNLAHDSPQTECFLLNDTCHLRFPVQRLSNRKDILLDLHSQFEFIGDWICENPDPSKATQDEAENWEYSTDISSFADPLLIYKVSLPGCKYKRRKWVRAVARRTLASKSFDEVHQSLGEFLPTLEPYSGPYDFIERQFSRPSELEKRPSLTCDVPNDGLIDNASGVNNLQGESKRRTSVVKRNSFISQEQFVDLVVQNPWPSQQTSYVCAAESHSELLGSGLYPSGSSECLLLDVSYLYSAATVAPNLIWLRFDLNEYKSIQNDVAFKNLFPESQNASYIECYLFVPNSAEMAELLNTIRLVSPVRDMVMDAIPQVSLCRESQSARYSLGILHRSWEVMHQERVKIATVLKRLRNYTRDIITSKAAELYLDPSTAAIVAEDLDSSGSARFMAQHFNFPTSYEGRENIPVELSDFDVSNIDRSLLLAVTILDLYHSILLAQTLDLSSFARISEFCLADSEENSRYQNPFDEAMPKLSILPNKRSDMPDDSLNDTMDSMSLSTRTSRSRSNAQAQSIRLSSSISDSLPRDGSSLPLRPKSSLMGPESFVPLSSKRKQLRYKQKSTIVSDTLRHIESLFDDTEMQILLSHSVETILLRATPGDASTSCHIINMIVTRWFRQMASSVNLLMKREVKSIDWYKLSHDLPSTLLDAMGTTHSDDMDELTPLPQDTVTRTSRFLSNSGYYLSDHHLETYLPVSSYLLKSNGRLALLLQSVASTSSGKETSQNAVISHFAEIKAVVEWELKPRIEFIYGWCMSFASVDFSQFVKVSTAPRSSGSHDRKLWSAAAADTTEEFLSRHATDKLTAAEELCLVFNEFLLPGSHELFFSDMRNRYSIFNEEGTRPRSTSSDDTRLHKRANADLYFAPSSIYKRQGRASAASHSRVFGNSSSADLMGSLHCTLVETFRTRNVLFLNNIRQVIHRSLQMLQVHYSDTLMSYAWFWGSGEGGGVTSSQRRPVQLSKGKDSSSSSWTSSQIAQLRRDISLLCLVANDCIDFNVLTEECYLALSTPAEMRQRAAETNTSQADLSPVRFGSSSLSGLAQEGGSSARGLAAILRRTAEQREQSLLQLVARYEQSYFIRFGNLADEFARMSVDCIIKLVDMLMSAPGGVNSPLISHSGGAIKDIIERAKLVLSDIRSQLMNGLFSFFIRLFLERVTELIVSNLALDMDGNAFYYALAIDDCGGVDANQLSQSKLLQDLRLLRNFCFAACLEVIPVDNVLRAYGEVPYTTGEGAEVKPEADVSTATPAGKHSNRSARVDSRSLLQKMGAVVNKISAATKLPADEAIIDTAELLKQLHEQWSFVQAVHPELGGFLSSLERRLELDVRGVSSGGGITQLPQACDIITAVRSVGWISRGAGLNGQSSQHNDVYVLLNLPSFRSTTERSFWFGDSTSSGGAAAVGGRGVGGLNAPGPVPTVRKSIAPLNLQVHLLSVCSLQYLRDGAAASSGPNVFAEVWFVGSSVIRHKYTTKIRNNDRFGSWVHVCQYSFDSGRMSECIDEVVVVLLEQLRSDKSVRPLGYSKVQVLSIDVCAVDAHFAIYPVDTSDLEWRRAASSHRLPECMVTTSHQRYRAGVLDKDLNSIGDLHVVLNSSSGS